MNNIQTPVSKTQYLLNAPVEVLHETSQEWLQEMEFYKDEVAFFYHLLRQKSKQDAKVLKTKEAHDIERHIIHVSVDTVNEMEKDIRLHEKFLTHILKNPETDQQFYRDQHQELSNKINAFRKEFHQLKKEVFQLSKENS